MTDIQAALGIAQLKKLEEMWKKRKEVAEKYNQAFKNTGIETLKVKPDRETSWHLYVIKVNNRDELYKKLKEKGIGTSVHFIPVYKHPYYKKTFGYKDRNYPVAEEVFKKSLSLPIYPGLSEEEVEYIIENVLKYAK
jgi:perosamine synthetase